MNIETRLQELREQAKLYADAEAERVYLEHFRQAKLAVLMKDAAVRGFHTVAAQDREARSNPEYLELLEGLREATRIAEHNLWLLKIALRGSSLYQTEQANMRAELKAYGTREA